MSRIILLATSFVGIAGVASAKLILRLCSPGVSLYMGLAFCYAVMDDLVPLPRFKHWVPIVVVAIYILFAANHFLQQVLGKPESSGHEKKPNSHES